MKLKGLLLGTVAVVASLNVYASSFDTCPAGTQMHSERYVPRTLQVWGYDYDSLTENVLKHTFTSGKNLNNISNVHLQLKMIDKFQYNYQSFYAIRKINNSEQLIHAKQYASGFNDLPFPINDTQTINDIKQGHFELNLAHTNPQEGNEAIYLDEIQLRYCASN